MAKLYLLAIPFLLTACASVGFETEQIKTNELLGAGYEHLDGKLFRIFCGGNGYADYNYVKDNCLKNTAKFAHSKGYEYFYMVAQDGNTNTTQSGYVSNGVFIPSEVTKHSQLYTIWLITDKERDTMQNFYRVSDYYTPEP